MKTGIIRVAAMTAVLCLIGPAASAETWGFRDARDETLAARKWDRGDLARVRVDHAPRNVWVSVRSDGRTGDELTAYVDTRAGNDVPEFEVRWSSWQPGRARLYRVDRWGFPSGTPGAVELSCGTLDADARLAAPAVVTLKLPRGCLAIGGVRPKRVRASVSSYVEGYAGGDWAPGRHVYSPWLRRA